MVWRQWWKRSRARIVVGQCLARKSGVEQDSLEENITTWWGIFPMSEQDEANDRALASLTSSEADGVTAPSKMAYGPSTRLDASPPEGLRGSRGSQLRTRMPHNASTWPWGMKPHGPIDGGGDAHRPPVQALLTDDGQRAMARKPRLASTHAWLKMFKR